MAALKLPAILCMASACLGVTFPQRYERLYPVITQSLPQTLYQFLNEPHARELIPHLTTNPDISISQGTLTSTTTRKSPKSLPLQPKLEPITQASLRPITFSGVADTSSSYTSIGARESPRPSTTSPLLLTTLRPNDIPVLSEKDSTKDDSQRGDQGKNVQLNGIHQLRGDQTIESQSRGEHGTLFRSEVNPKTLHRLLDTQATPSRAEVQQQTLLKAANDKDISFSLPGNHEHSFSIINHGESPEPKGQHEVRHQTTSNDERTFNFQQKLLGSASKPSASHVTSARHPKTVSKNKKAPRSDTDQTAHKLHQKRDFGATQKVFFEHPHHQVAFEEPQGGLLLHHLPGELLHAGGDVLGASHHDLSFSAAPHLSGGSLHGGQGYHWPAKYDFQYVVKDEYGGNDFGHQETRNGHDTKGAYYVQLPDGRRQTVSYFVNKGSGFVAKVHYEGKAVHPQPKHGFHQSGAVSHGPVHQLETFDHVPKGHTILSSFGGSSDGVFSSSLGSKFH